MKKFNFNARNIAESTWGRGGTNQLPTNRKGVYYFSCSGHGGYVVKKDALTESERTQIEQHTKPSYINLLTNVENEEVYGADYGPIARSGRNRRFKYPSGAKVEWRRYEFYLFEEDCEYSVLEYFTDITTRDRVKTLEERKERFDSFCALRDRLNKCDQYVGA